MPYPTKKLWEICDLYQPKTISTKEMIEDWKYPVFWANWIIWKYNNFNHEEKELLITCRWATCWSINISEKFSWINWNAMVSHIKDNNIIYLNFLYYAFKNLDFSKVISGSAQPQITRWSLVDLPIPLPSLPTQKLIVQKLDSSFEKIDKSIELTKKNLENCDELNKSVLEEVFRESELEIKMWDKNYLDIVDWDRGKNYPKKSEFSEKWYCLFLNTSNVRNWFFNFDKLDFITEEKYNLLGKWKAFLNDIIVTTRWTIWNTAYIDENFPYKFVRINSWMVVLRIDLNKIFPKYLIHFINSNYFFKQKQSLVSWSAQPQLPIWVMRKIKIPLPPLEKQIEIVKYLDQVFEKNRV